MAVSDPRYRRGLKILKKIHGRTGEEILERLAETAPELSRQVIAFAFGDVYARPQLTLRERQIATVASVTALGHALPQLKAHINGALNLGISRAEIVEILMQMAVYAGFPAALNAVAAAAEVFAARADGATARSAARSPRKARPRGRPRAR